MKSERLEYAMKWIEKAEHDLIAAKTLIESRPMVLDIACFHCQQAVEKLLKAFLVVNNTDFRKTHDIILLQKMSAAINMEFSKIDFKNLGSFAIEIRYPDSFLQPELKDAGEFLAIAEQVKSLVKEKTGLSVE